MITRHTWALAAVAAGVVLSRTAGADEKPAAPDCPMHAAHQGSADAHRQGVDVRHDAATGVSHAVSVHHFLLHPDGGRIVLEATDAADTASRDRIRQHLEHVTHEFGAGHFDLPMLIHDRTPPGVEVLRRLASEVRYTYTPTAAGGQVDIVSASPEAREAIHTFLRFQIEDHGTGDAVAVVARP